MRAHRPEPLFGDAAQAIGRLHDGHQRSHRAGNPRSGDGREPEAEPNDDAHAVGEEPHLEPLDGLAIARMLPNFVTKRR